MSSVIDFLERVGGDAQWRTASHDEMELALAAAEVEMPLREAILAKDASKLEALLGQMPQKKERKTKKMTRARNRN
jgi:hypothetical protein